MANKDDKDERRRKSERSKRSEAPGIGNALKSAYQQTVNEDIPREMLDLLGKLG